MPAGGVLFSTMTFFAQIEPQAYHILPTLVVCQGEEEDSGEPVNCWLVEFAWFTVHVGFTLDFS